MAIYTFKQGAFFKTADSVEEILKSRIVKWDTLGELFEQFWFFHHDDVDGVYDLYRRRAFESPRQKLQGWMPDIQWVFVVMTGEEGIDLILVEDSLPDYLGVLQQLQPLVDRVRQRKAEGPAGLGVRG